MEVKDIAFRFCLVVMGSIIATGYIGTIFLFLFVVVKIAEKMP